LQINREQRLLPVTLPAYGNLSGQKQASCEWSKIQQVSINPVKNQENSLRKHRAVEFPYLPAEDFNRQRELYHLQILSNYNLKESKKMTIEKNKQVVIKFNKEFFESGNTEITKELLADNFVNHTAPLNAPTDASVMIQFITGFHKGFSAISVQIHEVLGESDKVSLRKTIAATHTGEFMGKMPTRKKVEMSVIEIDILKDGKITDHWSRNDFMQVVQGL
jgi:predicted ester cyclase